MQSVSDYRGVRHARLTKSMQALPPTALKVLAALRYAIADGESACISNAVLARRTKLSEGYVSACTRWLAGETIGYMPQFARPVLCPFIRRERLANGSVQTTMLPPPEQRTRPTAPPTPPPCPRESPPVVSAGDHAGDPLPESPTPAAASPADPCQGDHGGDPCIHVHACIQQQQPCAPDGADAAATERPRDIYSPRIWAEMLAGSPGYTRADWEANKAKLLNRPGYGIGMLIEAARRGQPVRDGREALHAAQQSTTPARSGAHSSGQRRHYSGADRAGRRHAASDAPPADAPPIVRISDQPLIDLAEFGLAEFVRMPVRRERDVADA